MGYLKKYSEAVEELEGEENGAYQKESDVADLWGFWSVFKCK